MCPKLTTTLVQKRRKSTCTRKCLPHTYRPLTPSPKIPQVITVISLCVWNMKTSSPAELKKGTQGPGCLPPSFSDRTPRRIIRQDSFLRKNFTTLPTNTFAIWDLSVLDFMILQDASRVISTGYLGSMRACVCCAVFVWRSQFLVLNGTSNLRS